MTPEEQKAADDKAKADADAKAKADADAKAEAERVAKLSPDELRQWNDRLKQEAIENRHKAKSETARADALAAELATFKAAEEKRTADELAAQGKYKELADGKAAELEKVKAEAAALKVKADKFETALTTEETALRAELGDKAPKLDALPLETRVETLRSVAAIQRAAVNAAAPVVRGPASGRTGPTPEAAKIEEQRAAIFADTSLSNQQKAVRLRALASGTAPK